MTLPHPDDPFADPLPPIPDVPYMIGIAARLGAVHAVDHATAVRAAAAGDSDSHRISVPAECDTEVMLARRWGAFDRGNGHLRAHGLCAYCAWTVALNQDTTAAELAALAPTSGERRALDKVLPDPLMAHRIVKRILGARNAEEEYEADHPRWVEHLAHITRHRPVVLLPEGCHEGDCDHDQKCGCYQDAAVACPACSILAGSWAGEWEGSVDMLVPAPCSVLIAAAKFHGAEVHR